MTVRRMALLGIVACAAAGCQDPYPSPPATPRPSRALVPSAAPDTARAFARRWINWDWDTLPRQQRALARLAGGRLATRLRADAEAAARDASLARDKPASRGTVAIVSLNHAPGGARGLVVTRERAYSDGHPDLSGARDHAYTVAVSASHDGLTVTRWSPQP